MLQQLLCYLPQSETNKTWSGFCLFVRISIQVIVVHW